MFPPIMPSTPSYNWAIPPFFVHDPLLTFIGFVCLGWGIWGFIRGVMR